MDDRQPPQGEITELAVLSALQHHAAPMTLPDLAAAAAGHRDRRPASAGELARVKRLVGALGQRGALSIHRAEIGGREVALHWVPGPLPPARARPAGPTRVEAPRDEREARPGPRAAALLASGVPAQVWTLHRVPGSPEAVLAVRRRVLEGGEMLRFEIARRPSGRVDAAMLAKGRGARAQRPHPSVWVYDHLPTPEERSAWRLRRALEVAALRRPPRHVWVVLPAPNPAAARSDPRSRLPSAAGRLVPDRAVRCEARRAPGRAGGGVSGGVDLEIAMPVRGYRPKYAVDLLELATVGVAQLRHKRSTYSVALVEPAPEILARLAEARRGRLDDAWFREDGAEFLTEDGKPAVRSPEAALAALGLRLPCSAEDVGRAFRRRVIVERAHPDQGGGDDELRELVRLRNLALACVDQR